MATHLTRVDKARFFDSLKVEPLKALPQSIALYVHWPYCAKICPYCDFNVYRQRASQDNEALLEALLRDMQFWHQFDRRVNGERDLRCIYFGGGTPSLLSESGLEKLINKAQDLWSVASGGVLDITLEANPSSIDSNKVRAWKDMGVNRLSLGVQSLDDKVLTWLGRDHDRALALGALECATNLMPQTSADLIFGHYQQTPAQLTAEIEVLLAYELTHISTYQLTIEPGTAFERAQKRGASLIVSSNSSADLYEMLSERLTEAKFTHYEVSNFAKNVALNPVANFELGCVVPFQAVYNCHVWQGGDYVGIGPGAHGRISARHGGIDGGIVSRLASFAPRKVKEYCTYAERTIHTHVETLSKQEWAHEYVLSGLRYVEGIDLEVYHAISGQNLDEAAVQEMVEAKFLYRDTQKLRPTPAGWLVLDSVCAHLLCTR